MIERKNFNLFYRAALYFTAQTANILSPQL